ncbi:hypothetical protein B0H19DRAFT_1096184 [Mycena capillaripes]|nr:hypothetical protein B0H19DRAFT_1096184 [Mycena capillaripes]
MASPSPKSPLETTNVLFSSFNGQLIGGDRLQSTPANFLDHDVCLWLALREGGEELGLKWAFARSSLCTQSSAQFPHTNLDHPCRGTSRGDATVGRRRREGNADGDSGSLLVVLNPIVPAAAWAVAIYDTTTNQAGATSLLIHFSFIYCRPNHAPFWCALLVVGGLRCSLCLPPQSSKLFSLCTHSPRHRQLALNIADASLPSRATFCIFTRSPLFPARESLPLRSTITEPVLSEGIHGAHVITKSHSTPEVSSRPVIVRVECLPGGPTTSTLSCLHNATT